MRTSLTFSISSTEPTLNTNECCTTEFLAIRKVSVRLWTHRWLNRLSPRKIFFLRQIDGFSLYEQLGIEFSPSLCYYNKIWKKGLRLVDAGPKFSVISDSPSVSLGILDRLLSTRRIVLNLNYHKKSANACIYSHEIQLLKTLVETLIIPARWNQFNNDNILNFSTMLQLVELPFQ